MLSIKQFLEAELEKKDTTYLQKAVIGYLLNQEDKDILGHLEDIIEHGGVSGIITDLIYYDECRSFAIEHMDEILELMEQYGIDITVNELSGGSASTFYSHLAWLGFEQTCYTLKEEFDNQ